jgi:sec-independent protein translocase protein TatA
MIGDLFDSPWKILIVAVVIIVLFGSRKLPDAARSLGRSMRILKSEVQGMHEDDEAKGAQPAAAQLESAQEPAVKTQQAQQAQQVQLAELQKQLNDLQQSGVGADGASTAESQQTR